MRYLLGLIAVVCVSASISAEDIGINFIGNDVGLCRMEPDYWAGLVGDELKNPIGSTLQAHWNNYWGVSRTEKNPIGSSGAVMNGVTISWKADNCWHLPDVASGTNGTVNTILMKGYLDNMLVNPITITVSGILPEHDTYSVVVYTDGENRGVWRRSSFRIGHREKVVEDSENVDFNNGKSDNPDGLFQIPEPGGENGPWPRSPNRDEGNVVIFTGLTESTFKLEAIPVGAGGAQRSPINAIQLIGVRSVID